MYGTPAYMNPAKAPAFQFTNNGCTNANGSHPCTHKNNETCISYHKHNVSTCPWATGDYSHVVPGYYAKDRTSGATGPATPFGKSDQSAPKQETWILVKSAAYGDVPEVLRTLTVLDTDRSAIVKEIEDLIANGEFSEDENIEAFRQVPVTIKVARTITLGV